MAGLLNIDSIAGSHPSWVLTVDDSSVVISGDHLAGPLLASTLNGGVWRVSGVPDGTTVNVEDDIKPVGAYGQPGPGLAQAYTPTSVKKLSQQVPGGPYWGDAVNRDLQIIDEVSPGDIKSGIVAKVLFSGNPATSSVVFATAFPDANYAVVLEVETSGNGIYKPVVESGKTAAGFTINMGTGNTNNLVQVGWHAIPVGE